MKLNFRSQHRLAKKDEFDAVFASKNKASYKSFLALYKANCLPYPRLGILVPKQKIKQAVVRNLVRRIVRESFRHHMERLKGLDIIVLIRSECNPHCKLRWRTNIDTLWQTIGKNGTYNGQKIR